MAVLGLAPVMLLLAMYLVPCSAGFVKFLDTTVIAQEGSQFEIRIQFTGELTSFVNVVVKVDNLNQDFVGSSQVASFVPGGGDVAMVTFMVNDDDEPEIEETYMFFLTVLGIEHTVGVPNIATVIIQANDDAYGVFSFIDPSPYLTVEQPIFTHIVSVNISRAQGTYGQVTVNFEVESLSPDGLVGTDISPAQGSVMFDSGSLINSIQLQIWSDTIPENDETFIVHLTSATQGARVDNSNFTITILANDAPVRFSQREYRFDEDPITRIMSLSVTRGYDEEGNTIGSVDGVSTVSYMLVSGTAVMNQDFRGQSGVTSGQVVFVSGQFSTTLQVELIDDNEPEVEEAFQVLLSSPSSDVILAEPSRADVIINANDNPGGVLSFRSPDFISPPVAVLNEDVDTNAVFTVIRTAGSFDTVTVQWEIIRNDSGPSGQGPDLTPSTGTVSFASGEREKSIILTVNVDTTPEPSERFLIRLLPRTVTGGAKVDGIISGYIILQDSDNYYGVVQFAETFRQKLVVTADPRVLQLILIREGANNGDIYVNFTVTYTPAGNGSPDVLEDTQVSAVMYSGQVEIIEHIHLLTSAFIQVGGTFEAEITEVHLVSEPAIGAFNTPSIGDQKMTSVEVTQAEANGEIGFYSTAPLIVSEPDSASTQLRLRLSREGSSGDATITWALRATGPNAASVTQDDLGDFSGTVIMQSGRSETEIVILVLPDDIPELDEQVIIELTGVEPASIQRLKVGAMALSLTISQNDNPGGIFQFSATQQLSVDLLEGGTPKEFVVVRTDGDLLETSLQYIVSGGEEDFFGFTNVLVFPAGVREKHFSVAAIPDLIPELVETFTLRLQNYGNATVVIGQRSIAQLRVLENDEPYGLLQFVEPKYYLNESSLLSMKMVSIPVERSRGQFGEIQVSWAIDPGDEIDLRPSSGFVTFNSDQDTAFITLESVPDDLTEEAEQFVLTLSDPGGGALIGSFSSTTIIIYANDFPLSFLDPVMLVEEPSAFVVTLKREGPLNRTATVRYHTVDGTAVAADGDYEEINQGEVTFNLGETEKIIPVRVLDDGTPEGGEYFFVSVYSIVGDLVFDGPNQVNVTIQDNDIAYGVFSFDAPFSQQVEEGSTVKYAISRDGGIYGGVDVFYQLIFMETNQPAINGGDFLEAENLSARFQRGERVKYIPITPRMDYTPEKTKTYKIQLTGLKVFDGRTDQMMARLADFETSALVTILASDDPSGKFGFPLLSMEKVIAEDFYPGMVASTEATIYVERRMGVYGTVALLWEVYTDAVAGTLPKTFDLIFLGSIPSSLKLVPSQRRVGTGSLVVSFTGNSATPLMVRASDQPHPSEMENGFSLTAWVQPFANTDGYLIAKTNTDGSRQFYTLRMVTSSLQTQLIFGYSITGSNENQFQKVSLQRNIEDTMWHHIVVTVDQSSVRFYVDTVLVGQRDFVAPQVLVDSTGRLTAGSVYPGAQQFRGYMQDVRIYTGLLTKVDILELYTTPAKQDVRPISGYITYTEGERNASIKIQSQDDLEEEGNEVFTVRLLAATGGATLSATDYLATLTVLKSDNANGLFLFPQNCQPGLPTTEDATIVCTVARQRGDNGQVVVTWVVNQIIADTAVLATEDFVEFTGQVVFEAGETSKSFSVQLKDDQEPEPSETFAIRLTTVSTEDGEAGSTDTSGASIDPSRYSSPVTIRETDHYFGLLEFSTLAPSDNVVIPPATERPVVHVIEEAGRVRLLVARAQGTKGTVTVEWRTTDGTARSSGKSPPDYMPGVGKLTFADGQRFNYIDITIADNNIPEDEKTFVVSLLNPSGGASLGVGSVVTVVIDHSDGAFGIFSFSSLALGIQAEETGDSGFNIAKLQLQRVGGSIGLTLVTWEVISDKDNDLVDHQGNVTFINEQLTADLELKVRGDTVPELDERFVVGLVAVSRGQLGEQSRLRSEVTIQANDDPYGKFIFPSSQRPVTVNEEDSVITMTIERVGGLFGAVEVNYTTLQPTENLPYLPATLPRAGLQDFLMTAGTVRFGVGVETMSFTVPILDDTEPEEDESIFVRLAGVRLLEPAQIRPVDGSPRLGSQTEAYGQIIINFNDNANGELVLSPLSPSIPENQTEPFLFVTRYGGAFGEVSVTFRVEDVTATEGIDYMVMSNTVTLIRGETSAPLDIRIINDNLPELTETFIVSLDQVSGGGVLGTDTSTTVAIETSDDPNGAFGFSENGQAIEEPDGSPTVVSLTIIRTGGTLGVVTLDWAAVLKDGTIPTDITPTAGSIFFVSNEATRTIDITVLPDNIPEAQEDIEIRLTTVSNGGRLGARNVYTLTVLSNDNPHGVVQFTRSRFDVVEEESTSVQQIPIARTGGSFGELKVYYSTGRVVLIESVISMNSSHVLSYFLPPVAGSQGVTGENIQVLPSQDPLIVCSRACLSMITCRSFEVFETLRSCSVFHLTNTDVTIVTEEVQHYVKDITRSGELTGVPASPGEDYSVVTDGYVLINEGETQSFIPISITADNVPELDEKFVVFLTHVDVPGDTPTAENSPYIGEIRNATLTILANDDTYGALTVYSDSPLATEEGHVIEVEEKDNLAVDLVVERLGGTLGEVTVAWSVDLATSTAVYDEDFRADGATLTFVPGETRKLISITVLDDDAPELSKTVIVQLSGATGGATIRDGSTTVVILENDNIAGSVGLDGTSVLAEEGDSLSLQVNRQPSQFGTVIVEWLVQGLNGLDASLGFQNTKGEITFLPGESSKSIMLDILTDDIPEINEEYQLHLSKITTTGVGVTGAATFEPQLRTASITIKGSNNPHGVIQFSSNSVNVRINEEETKVTLQLDRKFGAIGNIRVDYEITRGSVSLTTEELVLATPSEDFVSARRFVEFPDGSASVSISVTVVDDDEPEVDEVFIVRLLSVTLATQDSPAEPPILGASGTVAQVIINANDGTKGEVIFAPDSALVSVDEISKNISLTVTRSRGTFGEVSVFFYAQSIVDGTNLGLDYRIIPQELVFLNGINQKQIQIEIMNDEIPEPDEVFEVILSNPKNGLILGTPSRATVTILANDDPAGFIYFEEEDIISLTEPSPEPSAISTVDVVISRGPGMYGVINVPFEVIPELDTNREDLSPMQGTIMFDNFQNSATLTLTVLDDDIPEDAERFTLRLLAPEAAKLGTKTQRTIVIASNDSPYGLFSLYAEGTRLREVSVEEGVGMIGFDIVRSQGLEGLVSVDIATEPDTADTTADVSSVTLVPVQTLNTTNVGGWYSFDLNNTVYILMFKPSVVGELVKSLGSDGSAGPVDIATLHYTTLFRWQGALVPVQTVETDGVSSAMMFEISAAQYLVITNKGNLNRYETSSRLYRIHNQGTLTLLQNIGTKGATDVAFFTYDSNHYLVLANSQDNTGTSQVNTDILRWEPDSLKFTKISSFVTLGAQALSVFTVEEKVFLAVANYYDSVGKSFQIDSKIYRFDNSEQFVQHQSIPTQGAMDVEHIQIRSLDLLIFVCNRDNTVSSPQQSLVYRWDTVRQMFILHEKLETKRAEDVEVFTAYDDTVYAIVSNTIGASEMFAWDVQSNHFLSVWTGPPAQSLVAISVYQEVGTINLVAVADKNITRNPILHQLIKVKDSDFAPRTVTMTMLPGQDLLHANMYVLQDTIPEDTETFHVTLRNAVGGAEIGLDNRIMVNILSNDNAHGIIEIAQDSQDIDTQEKSGTDVTVQINVVRSQGYFGRVTIKWVATGDHDGTNDITPLDGIVEFATGQSVATISLTVRDDDLAELQEVTYIQLTEIIQSGTSLPGRGAVIGESKTAKITVLANDSPYGVVRWEQTTMTAEEPENTDTTMVAYLLREQGMMGDLQIAYQTASDTSLESTRQAISGTDFISPQGMVIMQENVTRVPVEIVIKQDSIPEAAEVFLVNLTRVTLLGVTPGAGSEPSIRNPGNILTVTIAENDNARGIIQFNVTTNIEGRIDMYEEFGVNTTLTLPVSRSVGLFGAVTITWQAEPREASILDFTPSSGTLSLADTQDTGTILITIIDDNLQEDMETFDIKLISVTGGAMLGPSNMVRIAILKNDSPNGLFRFVTTQAVVRESRGPTDPDGEVRLIVERIQGSEGVVSVQWRLNAEAVYDFYEPFTGSLLFAQGEKTKALVLRTKPDSILEGQEQFRVSLITADNNADISHTQGDATIIVLPDPGASGTISILPESRTVYIGEPGESDPNYQGLAPVVLTRGAGIYGDISVSWSITPRDESAFLQVEGTVKIVDLQQTASIVLQALDDSMPELRTVYTLQLNSATGGAILSNITMAITSNVVFVASDSPHGVFVFSLPETNITSEDRYSRISFPVIRRSGLNGQVLVTYKTYPGTASSYEDYFPIEGTLTFQHGEKQLFIDVQVKQDDIPEGLESFYLNLTSARLSEPRTNNYTEIGGLQLDMPPQIGALNVKEIQIERNDNSEGTIQFQQDAVQFTVAEEEGIARIPLIRTGGNFGVVTIMYIVFNGTATEGVDYVLPSGEVMFADQQRNASIDITIRDDSDMEYSETFSVQLTSTKGGALLGDRILSEVTIAKSDYPNGRFGFKGQLEIIIDNPPKVLQRMFSVERTGGLLGDQMVFWRILGPNNPGAPLQATNDIAFVQGNYELTAGNLSWTDGQGGERTFTLDIKPFTTWEVQKVFVIKLYKVQGSPPSIGSGEVSPSTGSVQLTISKFGHPNGIVRFDGPAQLEREVEEPDGVGTLTLQFPILRRPDTGTVGNIEVFWEIQGLANNEVDVQPRNGSVLLGDEERSGDIMVEVLPDDVPELTETYKMVLKEITGGAEIDTQFFESVFHIRYNDQPHGVFGIVPQDQSVQVDPVDLSRKVHLNFTRSAGTFGSVILTFTIKYDVPLSGILPSLTDGTVTFGPGEVHKMADIGIDGTGFLELGTTFSVSLIEVQFLGPGVTDPPRFNAGQTETRVTVPALAANSRVGFMETVTSVQEETSTSRLTIVREGVYGALEVSWNSGFPEDRVPSGFIEGSMKPSSGQVSIPHGVETKNFTVELSAKLYEPELFAVTLPVAPATTVAGGARLIPDRSMIQIEPHGLLRFAANSTKPAISEMFGKIYLQVVRLYGSQSKIETQYRTETRTAGEFDYKTIANHAIVMEPGETSGLIMIEVVQDNQPEQEEYFFVNLTHVEKFPTDTTPSISPRISYLYQSSLVTIKESNDPYGILCLEPESITVEEQYQSITLTIRRTGGVFGTVKTLVRTVGGGEEWTSQIVPNPDSTGNDTITDILGNRDRFTTAVGGTDYVVLDTEVQFKQGDLEKNVTLTILSDEMAETAETVLVYLTQPTGGARIAAGEPDGGKKGYSVVTIDQNDLSNGRIGFAPDSLQVQVNEDSSPTFTLKLARTEAYFGEVEISWIAKVNETSAETDDVVLAGQLVKTAGTALCPGRQAVCLFNISLVNDQEPEEELKFVIKLSDVKNDAKLNSQALYSHITVAPSDFNSGLIEFTQDSLVLIKSDLANRVRLAVARLKGLDTRIEVSYRTWQMAQQTVNYGVTINPALEGTDYDSQLGTLVFEPGRQELQYIDVNLTPFKAATRQNANPTPKQFFVDLRNPTGGASVNPEGARATVIIVEDKNVGVWNITRDNKVKSFTDDDIQDMVSRLDVAIQLGDSVSDTEMTLMEEMLDDIIDEGLDRKLPTQIINQLLNLMCKLLTPDKNDATRGRFSLSRRLENIAYMLVTDASCPSPTPPDMHSLQCSHARISAGRWPLGNIQNYKYNGQRGDEFNVPTRVSDSPTVEDTECADFHMIEYTSEQWFQKTDQKELLNNKVVAFGVRGRQSSYSQYPAVFKIHSSDRRVAPKQAQCVYYDEGLLRWVSGDICHTTNDLTLGTDDYVDCACDHLTNYAVKAEALDPGFAGYSVWFFISCFICMTGLVLAILAHHVCSISAMFSASLLMHMCFAAMATQICYVVAAYLSPDEILVYIRTEDNYRCIVMGLFLQYFFLAQFSWMMTQAINFWKILVLNDEHTDRKYVLFFLLGWGTPVVIIAVFYVIAYNLYTYVYHLPSSFIYGDVNNNGDICFLTNPYAALGGVILPVLLMLVIVAVVFVKAFQLTAQWQAYDDIYRGRYNISEIRTLLLFWAVIITTWLWGGLHMVYGHLWMLILFCIFNILQGLMAFILYSLLRNPCLVHCLGPQKTSSYSMNGTMYDPAHPNISHVQTGPGPGQYQFHPATLDVTSLKGSRASLLNESWERDSNPSRSTMRVKRTLPQDGNLYIDPPVYRQNTISDTKDFDDLLYALKTDGSFTPSDINSTDSDKSSETSSKIDKYELRRIDIADTHL